MSPDLCTLYLITSNSYVQTRRSSPISKEPYIYTSFFFFTRTSSLSYTLPVLHSISYLVISLSFLKHTDHESLLSPSTRPRYDIPRNTTYNP